MSTMKTTWQNLTFFDNDMEEICDVFYTEIHGISYEDDHVMIIYPKDSSKPTTTMLKMNFQDINQ